tara:strand:- start:922 stop:1590 length:669 start_codon:yes stop_codon:yes gene_type:complete
MRKFSIFFSSLLLLITLTTFNPNNLDTSLQLFKIEKIEIKNLKILDNKKIRNSFHNEFLGTNLLIIDERKIDKISNDNDLIDYIEFKKVYPSKIQIIIHEKETIAIINNKRSKFYLIKNGEEIKFFKNRILEKLPNIFGEQKNFLKIYDALQQVGFPISEIRSFYYFDIGRWDIILKDNKIIKLPVENFLISLKNYIELNQNSNFKKYFIYDYRIEDQLILN